MYNLQKSTGLLRFQIEILRSSNDTLSIKDIQTAKNSKKSFYFKKGLKMIKIVIIHGNGGCNSNSFWIPWLKSELEKQKFCVLAPTMPDNIMAKASVWLPYMREKLECDPKTIIIGHSSGAVAAMRYAEEHKVLGSVLVSPCYTDLDNELERIAGYYDTPWKWGKIKENQEWIIQFASTDDPFIPIQEARHIHEKLNTEYFEFTDQGHFGCQEMPQLLSAILKKI